MDDIIKTLAAQLGIGAGQAEAGAGAILKLIREQAANADFQQLLQAVPGASQWMGKATEVAGGDGGGLLGQAAGILGGLTGGGNLAEAIAALAKSGIGPETAMQFVPKLLELLQSKAGADLVGRLASSVPFLKDALGGAGGSDGLAGALGNLFR
jgi:hypothetical protein